MKADKEFYDTLRAEVRGMKDGVSTNFIMISKGRKPIEEVGLDELKVNTSEEILSLKETIEGLQSQVKILKEQNSDLARKNKSLEEELSSVRTSITAENTSEESTSKAYESDDSVSVSIEEIAKWAFEQNEDYWRAFKVLLVDFDITPSKELRELMDKYNQIYKQSNLLPTGGTVILHQDVQNQVNGVSAGATGINVNKATK